MSARGTLPTVGHLGTRVSALLDGHLSDADAERAWAHVHTCHCCRDLVEREGWLKTRLATLGDAGAPGAPGAPDGLKGSLRGLTPADLAGRSFAPLPHGSHPRSRRATGIAALGGSAVGAAMLGVLALGVAPASAPGPSPQFDRRLPVSGSAPGSLSLPMQVPVGSTVRR